MTPLEISANGGNLVTVTGSGFPLDLKNTGFVLSIGDATPLTGVKILTASSFQFISPAKSAVAAGAKKLKITYNTKTVSST